MSRDNYTPKDVRWYREMTRKIDLARRDVALMHSMAALHFAEQVARTPKQRAAVRFAAAVIAFARALTGRPLRLEPEVLRALLDKHLPAPKAEPGGPPFYTGGEVSEAPYIRGEWAAMGRLMEHRNDAERYLSPMERGREIVLPDGLFEQRPKTIIERHYGLGKDDVMFDNKRLEGHIESLNDYLNKRGHKKR